MRRRISTRERVDIFNRNGGICHLCAGKITVGEAWDVEHIIPLAQGGDDDGDNLQPAHRKCHAVKSKQDATNTARAKRREAIHLGARKSARPIAGSKASGIRRRMNGTVEKW
jgi:5-methylcytosine-specific restriction protein A